MKKIFVLAILMSAVIIGAQAQRTTKNYPQWTLSKEVQKQQFRNVLYSPATITTASAPVMAKGIVALQSNKAAVRKTKVNMGGKPAFVISKGVARMQYENTRR